MPTPYSYSECIQQLKPLRLLNTLIGQHHKFTITGKLIIMAVGTEGSGPIQFNVPFDVTFNASNSKVYVVDCCNHRVQVLNSDLAPLEKKAVARDSLSIHGVHDSIGKVHVIDAENNLSPNLHS